MQIESYFREVEDFVQGHPFVRSSHITFDDRGAHTGFIRGDAVLIDDSTLHWREYVDVQQGVLRLMYSYQHMDSNRSLIFRYDNTEHHSSIATYPHHKHSGSEANVEPSTAPSLADVLAEIVRQK